MYHGVTARVAFQSLSKYDKDCSLQLHLHTFITNAQHAVQKGITDSNKILSPLTVPESTLSGKLLLESIYDSITQGRHYYSCNRNKLTLLESAQLYLCY